MFIFCQTKVNNVKVYVFAVFETYMKKIVNAKISGKVKASAILRKGRKINKNRSLLLKNVTVRGCSLKEEYIKKVLMGRELIMSTIVPINVAFLTIPTVLSINCIVYVLFVLPLRSLMDNRGIRVH